MLSRFAYFGGQGLKNSVVKYQPKFAITTSAVAVSENTPSAKKDVPFDASKYPPEFPPATSKRDFVNFPRMSIREEAPKFRMAFIPESWFAAFYPKTGYTGPYMLMVSLGTYLFSKEIIVYDHNLLDIYAFILFLSVTHYKLGPLLKDFLTKQIREHTDWLDSLQYAEVNNLKRNIDLLESKIPMKDALQELIKARVEIIQLQLELAYRQRLEEVYKTVKNKLDCKAELENVGRRIAQRNLVDYVIKNVMKSITPDIEKNAMQACIADLNSLAARV